MDKLQPLIKHRYWICFGLSVVFVVVGWWMASGAIAIEIEDRMKKVEESFTKATQGATKPNKSWVEAAKKENEADTLSYDRASKQLLQRQKNARKWPDALVNSMKGISYRQDLKDTTTRARWASIYRDQIEQLLQIVKPFKDGEGLVLVDTNKISHKPFNSWRTSRPSSTEIWNCQEDIWLLESLLKSIARVNEGATRLTESQIRQIFKLQLRGGDRDAAAAGGAAAGGMGGMSMSGGEGMGAGYMAGGMGAGGEMGGGGSSSYPGKEFEGSAGTDILTEEFGAFSAGGAGGMGMGGMATMGSMGSMAMSGGAEGMAGGAAGAAPAEEKRYVDGGDGDTTLGYKTRAFLLDVMIRDDQVPNLLASLTNSDFPVEIVRVEIVSKLTPSKGAGGMTGGPGIGEMGIGSEMAGGMTGMSEMAGTAEGGGYAAEDPYASTGGFGGEGVGLQGSGGAEYDPSALNGGSAAMGMAPGMSGLGVAGGGVQGAKGKEVVQAAMNDPLLVLVKIGGLMTLYQSAQEADAEAATAETDQASAPAAAPDASGAPAQPAAEGTVPAEGTAPADGAAPAEGTAPAAAPGDPGAPTDPALESEKPVTNDAPATPAEGAPTPASPPTDPGTAAPGAAADPAAPSETPTGSVGSDPTSPPTGDAPTNP